MFVIHHKLIKKESGTDKQYHGRVMQYHQQIGKTSREVQCSSRVARVCDRRTRATREVCIAFHLNVF